MSVRSEIETEIFSQYGDTFISRHLVESIMQILSQDIEMIDGYIESSRNEMFLERKFTFHRGPSDDDNNKLPCCLVIYRQ